MFPQDLCVGVLTPIILQCCLIWKLGLYRDQQVGKVFRICCILPSLVSLQKGDNWTQNKEGGHRTVTGRR